MHVFLLRTFQKTSLIVNSVFTISLDLSMVWIIVASCALTFSLPAWFTSGCQNSWNTRKVSRNHLKSMHRLQYHHNTLLIGAPPVSTRDLHRSGISEIRARISSIVILLYSSCRTSSSSLSEFHMRRRTLYLRMF